jgi:hypothetical protein
MSDKNEQIKKYIQKLVHAEVRRLVPDAVRQVLAALVEVAPIDVNETAMYDNSVKRQKLQESNTGHEPYPSLRPVHDSSHMADLMGYGEYNGKPSPRAVNEHGASGARRGIQITEMMSAGETGNPIPVDPSTFPPELQKAFSRDYTELVRAMVKK